MESRYTWKNQLILGVRNSAILAGIVMLLVYLVLVSGQAAKEELDTLFVEEKATITLIEEPVAYGYEDGAKIWELRSEVAEQEKETESSNLTRIYELILFKGGEPNLSIRGDTGVWDKPRETLTLIGNVVVESSDRTTLLNTEKLIWNERGKVLRCPVYVDFWVEDNHITAESLYSDDDLATIDFVGDVHMFVVGLEGENFVTREGDFPLEDVEDEEKGDGMNILAEYVHYDKGDKECFCYPFIPFNVQKAHHIDEEGNALPDEPRPRYNLTELLTDPVYSEALQRSVGQLDLSAEELAFIRGETDEIEPSGGLAGALGLTEPPGEIEIDIGPSGISTRIDGMDPATGEMSPMMDGTAPMSGGMSPMMGGERTPMTGGVEIQSGPGMAADNVVGPEITGLIENLPDLDITLPEIPKSDPEEVKTVQDYSHITDWQISENLDAELFEGDDGFDPDDEIRDGLVFCYRKTKKIWCEELYIDLGEHRIDAMRQADGRFKDLKGDEEPSDSRAGRAIQESPTQFIGNYIVHNWRDDMTRGFGRVLVLQAEKDFEADNVVYSEEAKVIHAWGNVLSHQYSGNWWETSGAIEDVDDDRAREDVKNPSVMVADAMLSYNRVVTWGFGNVIFKQEEQVITGDRSQYEDETEILIMAGSVDYENEDGELLSCALLTLDTALDEYIAEGAAIIRSIVPEEHRENLAEFRDDEETKPEDDARARLLENRTAAGLGDWTYDIEHPPPPPIEVIGGDLELEVLESLGPEIDNPVVHRPEIENDDEIEDGGISTAEPESAVEMPEVIETNEEATTVPIDMVTLGPADPDPGDETEEVTEEEETDETSDEDETGDEPEPSDEPAEDN